MEICLGAVIGALYSDVALSALPSAFIKSDELTQTLMSDVLGLGPLASRSYRQRPLKPGWQGEMVPFLIPPATCIKFVMESRYLYTPRP
jgi:hypothetical protein